MTESTSINQKETTGKTYREIVGLFRKEAPVSMETKNKSHGCLDECKGCRAAV